ncbi:MAG TPA: PIN domain-containing protein, partial [Candidatus Dormibacteraeota bacterium]|nr:PIN domain-containing protein [Candidatus Dormibacteraeota bacterium]
MIALDTNVVIDIGEGPQERVETAMQAIERAGSRTGIVICGVVYAELHARQNGSAANLADILRESHIAIDFALSQEIWQSAGLAFAAHANLRRSDGGKT